MRKHILTTNKALTILVRAAENYLAGSGTGIRSMPSENQKEEIKQAVDWGKTKIYQWYETEYPYIPNSPAP